MRIMRIGEGVKKTWRNPFINFDISMQQLREIHKTNLTNPCNNLRNPTVEQNATSAETESGTKQGNDQTWVR